MYVTTKLRAEFTLTEPLGVAVMLVATSAGSVTVKIFEPVEAVSPSTTKSPVVAPEGTLTSNVFLLAFKLRIVAETPLNLTTELLAKPVPVTVTFVPTGPEVGVKLVKVLAQAEPLLNKTNSPITRLKRLKNVAI